MKKVLHGDQKVLSFALVQKCGRTLKSASYGAISQRVCGKATLGHMSTAVLVHVKLKQLMQQQQQQQQKRKTLEAITVAILRAFSKSIKQNLLLACCVAARDADTDTKHRCLIPADAGDA